MARILGLDEVDSPLKAALASTLRVYDEAVVLPQAHRSSESGAFKNVSVKLSGAEGELGVDVFSPNWFAGVSALIVPPEVAEPLLKNPEKRAKALRDLVAAISSEMESSDVQVGPELDGDEQDRDKAPWVAGFDSPSCCVGLFSAQQSRAPDTGLDGMHRAHTVYFLLAKAGGGVAAQTFHSRVTAALSKGASLDECLKHGTSPGPQGLRRVSLAAQRNRARILEIAAKAIGFFGIDTIGDNAAPPSHPYRLAIPMLNVHTNVLREVENSPTSMWHYAAGCVDASCSQGVITSSNPAEGFVTFTDSNGGYKLNVRNSAYNCLPFSSERIANNRDVVMKAAEKHKQQIASADGGTAHPDLPWLRERFGWKTRTTAGGLNLEPPALWGTHTSESYVGAWGRELGIAECRVVRLQPEIVAIAGVEAAKLRAASRHVGVGTR